MQFDAIHVVLVACCVVLYLELAAHRHATKQQSPPRPAVVTWLQPSPPPPSQHQRHHHEDTSSSSSGGVVVPLSRGVDGAFSSNSILFNATRMEFALATDLDRESRDPQEFRWRSIFKRGTLVNEPGAPGFRVEWWADQVGWSVGWLVG